MPSHSMLKLANISAFVLVIIFTLSEIVHEDNAGVKNRRIDEFGVVQIKGEPKEGWQLTHIPKLHTGTDSASHHNKFNRR